MGVQSNQQKATPVAPAVTGGKNQQPSGGAVQAQNGYAPPTMAGYPMHNDMMARMFGGFGGVPGSQGPSGMAQGFHGGSGQMRNPNMGGFGGGTTGFTNSTVGGNVGGPGTQQGGNLSGGGMLPSLPVQARRGSAQ